MVEPTFAARSLIVALLLAGCGACSDAPDIGAVQSSCASDDPRVGTEVDLEGRAHGVSGLVAIVDDCTLELRDFHFDGGGLDVRAIGSLAGDFENGSVLSNDLRRSGGYDGETVRLPLPVGITLDDVQQLSIWCVPAAADFGSADLAG